MRSSRPSSRWACSRTASGIFDSAILRSVLVDDRGVVLAELLADRLHLLAQEVLALLGVGALLDVVADALADLELGQPRALQLERQLEPLGDVDGLEQPLLVGEAEVGAVAGGVGERARLGDRAQERRHAAVVAAQLEDLLDHGAVLALELADPVAGVGRVGKLLDLDHERAVGAGLGLAGAAAMQALEGDRVDAAGQAALVDHLGDGADRCRTRRRGGGARRSARRRRRRRRSSTVMPGKRMLSSSGTSRSCISCESFSCAYEPEEALLSEVMIHGGCANLSRFDSDHGTIRWLSPNSCQR